MQLFEAELAEVASVKEHDVVAVLLICNAPALIISSLSSIQPDAATQVAGEGLYHQQGRGWMGWVAVGRGWGRTDAPGVVPNVPGEDSAVFNP